MTDTIYRVKTVYETDASQAERTADSIAAKNRALASSISSAAGRLTGLFDRAAASAFSIGAGIATAAGAAGIGALIHGVTSLNVRLESTGIAIAGMLQAGGATQGWGASVAAAQGAMAQIRRDAAALPGEAQDFVSVFQLSLPAALEAGLRDPRAVASFTNQFGAVAIELNIDAEQAGRDLNLILRGHAGAQVRSWGALASNIASAGRELGITADNAEAFNTLRPEQRLTLVRAALGRYNDMVSAFGGTWDAAFSTMTGNARELLRLATQPLFERATAAVIQLNSWFDRHETQIRRVATTVGTHLVEAFSRVEQIVRRVAERFEKLGGAGLRQRLSELGGTAMRYGGAALAARAGLGLAASPMGPAMLTGLGGLVGGGALAGGGILAAILLPLVAAIADGSVNIGATIQDIVTGMRPLITAVRDLATALAPLASAIGTTMVQVVRDATVVLGELVTAIRWVLPFVSAIPGNSPGAQGGERDWWDRVSGEIWRGVRDAVNPFGAARGLIDTVRGRSIEQQSPIDRFNVGGAEPRVTDLPMFRSLASVTAEERQRRDQQRERERQTPRHHTTVHLRLEQTINDASDPDRVIVETRRLWDELLRQPIQSPDATVLR